MASKMCVGQSLCILAGGGGASSQINFMSCDNPGVVYIVLYYKINKKWHKYLHIQFIIFKLCMLIVYHNKNYYNANMLLLVVCVVSYRHGWNHVDS